MDITLIRQHVCSLWPDWSVKMVIDLREESARILSPSQVSHTTLTGC